ncbi:DNA repair protein REV1 (AtREV1) (Rev1-like terminal deoxycytidyl transferase) [Durusdinium trenchii]|uniref:DNA repair protein REV1 (AtREV1) (Rev1-like terminal deoxycytidyl transferase) n=1 Tax=Durusdinium trenchii TaxID=1381693 RepID=A0ABP0RY46_9DINO
MAKFNPFPAPKKGKARMVQKRPASTKSKAWSQVPYTRDESAVQPRGLRMDQSKWKRSLLDLVRANDKGIVEKLVADKILVSWEGKQCPKCEHGTLSKLKPGPRNGSLKHKCNDWRCKAWLNPHYLHPLFTECKGPEGHPLQIQSALLSLLLNKVSNGVIHNALRVNHKAIEDMRSKLAAGRKKCTWVDVEGDETTFDKKPVKKDGKNLMEWEQWVGMVQRGQPDTLILHRLRPELTEPRAGSVRLREQIRSIQYEYWNRNKEYKDLWVASGGRVLALVAKGEFCSADVSIASFFAKAKVDGAEEVSGVEDDVLPTQAETQSDASDGGSERAPEATSVEATSVGPKDRQPANVAEFHKASRLHFLGTWRERFERWRAEGGAGPRSSHDVTESLRRDLATLQKEPLALWAHLDMDCFFASVATRDMDAPGEEVPTAVVSGLGPSSEICSANYAARRAGVNTHLWFVERATSILPSLRLVPISSELLRSVEDTWKQVYQLLVTACHDVPDNVLMRSCDESALRVEGFADPVAWAEALRKAVFQQTGCTCSVGLGPTQLVAKLATKACKPNGVRRVLEDEVKKFVGELPLKDMPQAHHMMPRTAAVPAPKNLSAAPSSLSMPRSAPLIAPLGGGNDEGATSTGPRLRENTAANPFKLAKSGFGGTGSGTNQGVIAGAEYVRGPLQPTWAAQLAEARHASASKR